MTNKPVALDICCRKGGATVGLQRAGFYVIGVDIDPQPGYPGDMFLQDDGLVILRTIRDSGGIHVPGLGYVCPSFVWESWPCQAANTQTKGNRARGIGDDHEQFIPRGRELSDKIGIPYVLEQPTSSEADVIRRDLTLCMDMFKGDMPPPWVQKHRSFELSGFTVPQPEHRRHDGYVRGWRGRHGDVPGFYRDGPYVAGYGDGGGKGTPEELAHAMQMPWVIEGMGPTRAERRARQFDLQEAIPPAFSQYIGEHFLKGVRA